MTYKKTLQGTSSHFQKIGVNLKFLDVIKKQSDYNLLISIYVEELDAL
ncbi:MAG: hypothetical protein O3A58_00675 [Proteobacteria bacterium]|nr:hypothetical protein [Pseudomonadota bacterium]